MAGSSIVAVVLWHGWVVVIIVAAAILGGILIFALVRRESRDAAHTAAFVGVLRKGGALVVGVVMVGAVVWVITDHTVTGAKPVACATTSQPVTAAPTVAPSVSLRSLPAGATYVALGDSYSAGEGLTPFEVQKDASCNNCDRSPRGYPRLLKFANPVTVVFVACSGATLADVASGVTSLDRAHKGPLELDNIDPGGPNANHTTTSTGPSAVISAPAKPVGLATITISGNDALFSQVVVFCAKSPNCLVNKALFTGGDTLQAWAQQRISDIKSGLGKLFALLDDRMPQARIVVLGYPQLFTAGSVSPVSDGGRCAAYRLWSRAERVGLRAFGTQLNNAIGDATRTRAEYIDEDPIFAGHETCTPREWVRFATLSATALLQNPAKVVSGGSFHPNAIGQQVFARSVACYLQAHPDAVPTSPDSPALIQCARPPLPQAVAVQ